MKEISVTFLVLLDILQWFKIFSTSSSVSVMKTHVRRLPSGKHMNILFVIGIANTER